MDIEKLKEFGMTSTEAKVYSELALIKESKIGDLVKRTGLHRGSVYNALNDLIEKGFVNFIDSEGTREYSCTGERIFKQIIEDKKGEVINQEKGIHSFFAELDKIKSSNKTQRVKVFSGINSFKNLFLEMYEECKKNNWEYYFQGMGGEMQDAVGVAFYKHTQKLKNKLKLRCKIISDKKTKVHSYNKFVQGTIKYIDSDRNSPTNIWIYGNTILMVLFETSPLISIKIEHKETAEAFRSYFEKLWSVAK